MRYAKKLRLVSAWAALSALMAGCSGSPSSSLPKISSVDPLSTGKLQFVVGTANLYGTATGLNVVSTYRQASGLSNVLVDTPKITGPFTLPAASAAGSLSFDPFSTLEGGPSVEEVKAEGEIMGTSQILHAGFPVCDSTTNCVVPDASGGSQTIQPNTSTFGQAGGVFTNGIAPGNYTNQGVASSYTPYNEPLYDTTSGNSFVPFGGPPAFPGDSNGLGLRDGLFNLGDGVLGIPEGISTFAGVVVHAGTYHMAVTVPTGFNGATETFGTTSQTATLTSTALLGTITAPTLVLDGAGGGSVTIAAFPAGVTEELVQIVDTGDGSDTADTCQGAIGATADGADGGAGPVYYTILFTAPATLKLPDTIGPNTTITSGVSKVTPSESICTAAANTAASGATDVGDSYTVQAIGADYPLFESLYPSNTSQTPTLVGANGQADITISAVSAPAASASRARNQRKSLRRM